MKDPEQHAVTDWVVEKIVYHHYQHDGSIIQRIAFRCPAKDCNVEFPELSAISEHISKIHTVCSTPECEDGDTLASDSTDCIIEEIRLPDGEVRLVCPACKLQFPTSAYDKLCEHAAREHGWFLDTGETESSSEGMDLLFQGVDNRDFALRDIARSRLHVISLGSYCSIKLSMQHMGLGEAHLPFDWIRTSSAGIGHFLNNGFKDFFSVASKRELEGGQGTEYRSKHHTFVHDDITKQAVREKLGRRIERFLALAQDSKDLLFVRACASTDELAETEDLYASLMSVFGNSQRRVLLALVVDGQADNVGSIRHTGLPGVIFIPNAYKADMSGPVYCKAIKQSVTLALEASVGCSGAIGFGLSSISCASVQSGTALLTSKVLQPCRTSSGVPDLSSFESSCTEHVDLSLHPGWPLPVAGSC
eukprot:TRINITY_DN60277_c0_g1_i1.p1 TRINITY_DN60277_c0_g1~~TRINITY_DN60277_c0_g1_i1.p1  ORF type:complete len:419 (-),score=49.43 TRINITY_DN60277_c0_g1_i1:43-1299(-)